MKYSVTLEVTPEELQKIDDLLNNKTPFKNEEECADHNDLVAEIARLTRENKKLKEQVTEIERLKKIGYAHYAKYKTGILKKLGLFQKGMTVEQIHETYNQAVIDQQEPTPITTKTEVGQKIYDQAIEEGYVLDNIWPGFFDNRYDIVKERVKSNRTLEELQKEFDIKDNEIAPLHQNLTNNESVLYTVWTNK